MSTLSCELCNIQVSSRNKLFEHLELIHGHYRLHPSTSHKIILLVGWIAPTIPESAENKYIKDTTSTEVMNSYADVVSDALFEALNKVDSVITSCSDKISYTRGSGFSSRGPFYLSGESSCHGIDTFSFQLRQRPDERGAAWLEQLNATLPSNIRALEVYLLPKAVTEFHAEGLCSQRRYEYILPLSAIMSHQTSEVTDNEIITDEMLERRKQRVWSIMDNTFSNDTESTKARIKCFRVLKRLFKLSAGKQSFHNFVVGGACYGDKVVYQRMDRMFHKSILSMEGHEWALFSVSGSIFLRGQVRKLIGLAVAVINSWLPIEYAMEALSSPYAIDVPSAPNFGCYLSECRFDKWEAKYGLRLDSRRVANGNSTVIDEWTTTIHKHIASQFMANGVINWMDNLKQQCDVCLQNYILQRSLRSRNPSDLKSKLTGLSPIPDVYKEVLSILQEIDHSGNWPATSTARQKVIENEVVDVGGSFSIGILPSHLQQPRASQLFPELLKACTRLELAICPHRLPSSTIAVNKNVMFLPHRDNGAGNGQTQSLIVGLGDYGGGEIIVEHTAHDIRYQPIEFDGWSERHWTMPFEGVRYSLVWFTPYGVKSPQDIYWLDEQPSSAAN